MLAKSNKIELSERIYGYVERGTDPLGCQVPIVSRKK